MAPARNRRDADYSNVGVAGRKTGALLKDTGIRDENGLEPIEGIFSSPEKSPIKHQSNGHNSLTIIEDTEMDIGQSTIPEPAEVLGARQVRSVKARLPPPRARSPLKTALNTSPRRSMGPVSSPIRQTNETPSRRASSHPVANPKLDLADRELLPDVERLSQKGRLLLSSSISSAKGKNIRANSGKNRKLPFDLGNEAEGAGLVYPAVNVLGVNHSAISTNYEKDQQQGDITLGTNYGLQDDHSILVQSETKPKATRGRPRKAIATIPPPEKITVVRTIPMESIPAKRKRGRPKASQAAPARSWNMEPVSKKVSEETDAEEANPESYQDMNEGLEDGPSKPAKRQKSMSSEPIPVNRKSQSLKPRSSERDPSAAIKSVISRDKATSNGTLSSFLPLGRPKSRSLFVLRHETPADDDGAKVLKSGRTSVKPLAFWRNEQIIYGDSKFDGKDLVLPGIKEVVRTDEVLCERPKQTLRRRVPRKKHPLADVEEEDDEGQEDWERGPGILRAEVLQWDPVQQRGVDEYVGDIELALAPVALEDLCREVKGAEFRYAKMLTLPFFHSGMVELPPGGEKRTKNSRQNHMVFWVFYGRVMVEVSGNRFSIGKGGMWQVPRGNFYSIANSYQRSARIFFAQGCYMTDEEGEDLEDERGPSQ